MPDRPNNSRKNETDKSIMFCLAPTLDCFYDKNRDELFIHKKEWIADCVGPRASAISSWGKADDHRSRFLYNYKDVKSTPDGACTSHNWTSKHNVDSDFVNSQCFRWVCARVGDGRQ